MEKVYLQDDCYIATDDTYEDWWGTYQINGEEYLKLHICIATPMNLALVGVWGHDDFGMNISFPVEDYKKAIKLYDELQNTTIINKELLLEKGFKNAMEV